MSVHFKQQTERKIVKSKILAVLIVVLSVAFTGCNGTLSSRESGPVTSKVVHEAGTGNLQQALKECDYGDTKNWNSCVQAYDPENSYRLVDGKVIRGGGSEKYKRCRLYYVYDNVNNALLGTTCVPVSD